jgi:hypothetical protein
MNTFIEQIDQKSDVDKINSELTEILKNTSWQNNQLGLRHKSKSVNVWHDSVGSLYDHSTKTFKSKESDFNMWSLNENSYIREQITLLSSKLNFEIGRARFMKLLPFSGLSVHQDSEYRYHLVIKTNPKSYICVNSKLYSDNIEPLAQCYHLPKNNQWFKVDTTKTHWVYNGGNTERIHLVVCSTK